MVLERRVVERALVAVVHEGEFLAELVQHVGRHLHAVERAEVAVHEREAVGRQPQQEVARAEREVLEQRAHVEPLACERERTRLVAQPVEIGAVVSHEHGQTAAGHGARQLLQPCGHLVQPCVDARMLAVRELLGQLLARLLHEALEPDAVLLGAGAAVRGQVERYQGRLLVLEKGRVEVREYRDAVFHGEPPVSVCLSVGVHRRSRPGRRGATHRPSIATRPQARPTPRRSVSIRLASC